MVRITNPRLDLRADGVPDHQRRLMVAMRCIVNAAADPGTPFTIEAIAERTGMSQATVREALSSDEYRGLLQETLRPKCHLALMKGLHVTVDIMMHSRNDRIRLAAFRQLVELHKTLATSAPVVDSAVGEQEVLRLLREMDSRTGAGPDCA